MSGRSTEVHSIILGLGLGHEWKFSYDRSETSHLQQHTCSTPAAARQAGGALTLTRSAHGQRCSRAASVPSRCVSGAGWADLMRQACSASALPGARELLAARQTEISYANLSSEVQASHRPETKILV